MMFSTLPSLSPSLFSFLFVFLEEEGERERERVFFRVRFLESNHSSHCPLVDKRGWFKNATEIVENVLHGNGDYGLKGLVTLVADGL